MRPTKLSSKVFLELPPTLAHYLEAGRNVWLESIPSKGKLSLMNRPGVFADLESLAVERKQLVEMLGEPVARALRYRLGFEQGRRDAARHYAVYAQNARLALQAGPVFGQMQGRYTVEPVKFEFDLQARTLYRELVLHASTEGIAHRMAFEDSRDCACWTVAGYLSGQVSEVVGRHVVTLELDCCAKGDAICRFVSKLESEWNSEADWVREALQMEPLDAAPRRAPAAKAPAPEMAPSYDPEDIGLDDPDDGRSWDVPAVVDDDVEPELEPQPEPEPLAELDPEPEVPAPVAETDPLAQGFVAGAPAMQPVVRRLRQLKDSPVPVLLVGEPGTGRQTFARLAHAQGVRAQAPFVALDCSGASPEALARDLFGYVAGAFPGALRDHAGALARANGGTLYLDELTALSPDAQGRLVRALEDGAVVPLGGSDPAPADVRIIGATQHDPLDAVAESKLREDLYYTLAVARIALPPLRERGTDILRLAERFLQEFRSRYGKPGLRLSEEVKQIVLDCSWPGNVNQLRNVVEHAVVMCEGPVVRVEDLPEEVLAARWSKAPQDLTEPVIRAALRRCGDNRTKAAEVLGVGRTTLWRAMKRHGIE